MASLHYRRLLGRDLLAPPGNGGYNANESNYISENNFDTNMVIILAALLCTLICALGLNSIVRFALRCRRRFYTEGTEQAATGLKKRALSQIPVLVYGVGSEIPATECPICLGEFVEGERVRVLPKCNHGFHVKCIDRWLLSHSSCPNCRHSLLEKPAKSHDVEGEAGGAQRPRSVHQGVLFLSI